MKCQESSAGRPISLAALRPHMAQEQPPTGPGCCSARKAEKEQVFARLQKVLP